MRRVFPILLAGGVLAGALALAAPADAGYKARVSGGTLTLTGNAKGDRLALRLKRGAPGILQVDVGANGSADFSFRRDRFRRIVVNAGAGNDRVTIDERRGAFTKAEATRLNGGPGADRLTGGRYAETLAGGRGDDILRGLGGADAFTWIRGDGSDTLDGDGGADVLTAHGSAAADSLDVSPNVGRVLLQGTGDIVDIGTVERIVLNGLGGNDLLAGNAGLAGLTALTLNGGAGNDMIVGGDAPNQIRGGTGGDTTFGGGAADTFSWVTGDGADVVEGQGGADRLVVTGTGAAEAFGFTANGLRVLVDAAGTLLDVADVETMDVNALGGADSFSATGNLAALTVLDLDGGDGADAMLGSNGADVLRGGAGNDFVDGNQGADTAFLGAGNDTFQWDPGDGSDTVEGQAGSDLLVFHGSGANEIMELSPDGTGLDFTRNVGAIVMELGGLERVHVDALGGADTIIVNDLESTPAVLFEISLAGVLGGATGDAQPDSIIVNGRSVADAVSVGAIAGRVDVTGLAAVVRVLQPEAANDLVRVNGLGGADTLTGGAGLAALVGLTLDGGAGADSLRGGDGQDNLLGGTEGDSILGGAGNDSIDGGLGADAMDGQLGADTYVCLTPGDTAVQDGTDLVGPPCP